MPQIMEMEIFETAHLHRSTKRASKMAVVKQSVRVTRKHAVTLDRSHLSFALEDIEHETIGGDGSPLSVL